MEEQEIEQIKWLTARAVVLAAKHCKIALDFSAESIPLLESILESYCRGIKQEEPTVGQIRDMVMLWGAYLGETMLKCGGTAAGYVWSLSSGEPVLRHPEKWELSPFSKIEKRLKNGVQDAITPFFEIGMRIIAGKITV